MIKLYMELINVINKEYGFLIIIYYYIIIIYYYVIIICYYYSMLFVFSIFVFTTDYIKFIRMQY